MDDLGQPDVRKRAVLVAILIVGSCSLLRAQGSHLDGVWWLLSTAAEQEGFTLGYGDCWADPDVQRVRMLTDDATLRIAVSDYYQGHTAQRSRPVGEVLKDMWSGHYKMTGAERAQPGQGWRDRHGFFDGGWWKGSNSTERLGFVEGYTSCINSGKNKQASLQLAPQQYVRWVDRWYAGGGDAETESQRQAVKIRDVLMRVGNQPTAGAQ